MEDNEDIIEAKVVETQEEDRGKNSRGMYKDYGGYYDKPENKTGEGLGVASLVLGCVSLLSLCLPIAGMIPSILAIVFGVLGLKAINRGMAVAGLALGIITLLPQLFLLVLFIGRIMVGF